MSKRDILVKQTTIITSNATYIYSNCALHECYMFRPSLRPSSVMSLQKSFTEKHIYVLFHCISF